MDAPRFVFTCHRDAGGVLTDLCGGAHQDWSPRSVASVIADIDRGVRYAVPWSQGPIPVEVRTGTGGRRWLHSSGREDDANELDALTSCSRHGRPPQSAVQVSRAARRPAPQA